jgi:hypothetical protein
MKIQTATHLDLWKQIRKPTPPPTRAHKPRKEEVMDCRREIAEILEDLTKKIRHVDY